MSRLLAGLNIGGTNCSFSLGQPSKDGRELSLCHKAVFKTPRTYEETMAVFTRHLDSHPGFSAIGISCGGPLDYREGVILCPPHLPGWIDRPIVSELEKRYLIPAYLENDANAGAVAEWLYGAGKGLSSIVFLTCGTGNGAGLILDGRLYRGISGMAGEIGHVRLREDGPEGFGKKGSFDGLTSGSGLLSLAQSHARAHPGSSLLKSGLQGKDVAALAKAGDPEGLAVMGEYAEGLGRGLAMIVDILNPEAIVMGGVYMRNEDLLSRLLKESYESEVLEYSAKDCKLLAAGLGEDIGDYAALSSAVYREIIEGEKGRRP